VSHHFCFVLLQYILSKLINVPFVRLCALVKTDMDKNEHKRKPKITLRYTFNYI